MSAVDSIYILTMPIGIQLIQIYGVSINLEEFTLMHLRLGK